MSKPIKVLHVVTHMNRGGLESMIMNYYRKIDRTKVQFDFLTHRPETEKKDFDDEILSLGGKIFHISSLNPFSKKYLTELNTFFKDHPEYSIIHVHQDCLSGVILKAAKKNGVSVRIAHCHSSNQDKGIKYYVKILYKKNIKKYATKMFACGNKAGEWMFESKDFEVLPNAIDAEQFSYNAEKRRIIREQLGIQEGSLVIGHVGRFSQVKNHQFLIEVLQEFKNRNVDFIAIFAGNGELFENIKKQVYEKGLSQRVIFLGLVSNIFDYMQAMDIFLLPSLYEGLPVSIVEAQASGLKCIISDKVPMDCAITNLVKQVSLEANVSQWADFILEEAKYERTNTRSQIIQANYDIEYNARYLESYYLQKYSENSRQRNK